MSAPCAAREAVVADVAAERVVPTASVQSVVAGASVESVCPGAAREDVVSGSPDQVFDVDLLPGRVFVAVEVHVIRAGVRGACRQVDAHPPRGIADPFEGQPVVAVATDQRVLLVLAPDEGVVAVVPAQLVFS